MEKIRKFIQRARLFVKKYGFLATVGSGLFLCLQLYFWKPPPSVGLEFEAFKLGFMRPDFRLPADLKMMGFKKPSERVIGMSTYDMLMGWLRNVGNEDAANVELKVPCHGTLSIMRVSGWPDNPEAISKAEAVAVPDQYIPLGDLRADDPPFLLTLYAGPGQATSAKFRFNQREVTRTVSYVVRTDPSTGYVRITPEVLWGMDSVELKRFARNCGIGILFFGVLGYWQRRRILAGINHIWTFIVHVVERCTTGIISTWIASQAKNQSSAGSGNSGPTPKTHPSHSQTKGATALNPLSSQRKKKQKRRGR